MAELEEIPLLPGNFLEGHEKKFQKLKFNFLSLWKFKKHAGDILVHFSLYFPQNQIPLFLA